MNFFILTSVFRYRKAIALCPGRSPYRLYDFGAGQDARPHGTEANGLALERTPRSADASYYGRCPPKQLPLIGQPAPD
jgi:hypothetical protein